MRKGQKRCQRDSVRLLLQCLDRTSQKLTYADEEEEDAEHVEHGQQRHRERGDDLAQRRHAAEEPQDAKGAEDADDACVLVRDEEGNDGHDDDKYVNLAPRVGKEGPEPVSEGVDRELNSKDRCKEEVQIFEEVGDSTWRSVLEYEQGDEL
jgi:hypothetical protein